MYGFLEIQKTEVILPSFANDYLGFFLLLCRVEVIELLVDLALKIAGVS